MCSKYSDLEDPEERFEEAYEDLEILETTFSNTNAFGDRWLTSQSEDVTNQGQNVHAQEDVG